MKEKNIFLTAGMIVAMILSSMAQHVFAEPNDIAVARTLFQQRCNTAGEKITRTVEDVDGLLLLKIRSRNINYRQQFALDDPYGRDFTGDGYIESFLRAHHDLPGHIERAEGRIAPPQRQIGYMYVDASDPEDGKRYRYTGFIEQPGLKDPRYVKGYFRVVLVSSPTSEPAPRYGVTYEDISTADDRRYWIAGSSLKVIDLLRNEVIAERIGYMMDPGQGADGGGRSPWLMAAAHACPAFKGRRAFSAQSGQTARFVEKVLRPRPKNQ